MVGEVEMRTNNHLQRDNEGKHEKLIPYHFRKLDKFYQLQLVSVGVNLLLLNSY